MINILCCMRNATKNEKLNKYKQLRRRPGLAAKIRAHELWASWLEIADSQAPSARKARGAIMRVWREEISPRVTHQHAYACEPASDPHARDVRRFVAQVRGMTTPQLLEIIQRLETELKKRNYR